MGTPAHPVTIPAPKKQVAPRPPGPAVFASLLYLLLIDVAVETFLGRSPLRWSICAAVATYVAVNVLLWRKIAWTTKAFFSFFVLLALLAFAAWRPEGSDSPITMMRQPTSMLLSSAAVLGILLSGWILACSKFLPRPVRVALVVVAAYGVAAFAAGIVARSPFPALLHGASLWQKAPFWLQGAFLGGVVVVSAALLLQLATGISHIRAGELRNWGRQVLVLVMSLAIAVSGLATPEGSRRGGPSGQSGRDIAAHVDRVYKELESEAGRLPRDSFDPQAVVDQAGRDPIKLYEWVRDNTYWVPYQGSLRGPTGVLMDRFGNSMDRAMLLAELLRLAGQEVRLARGRLDEEKGQRFLAAIRAQAPSPSANPGATRDARDLLKTGTTLPQEQIDAVSKEWEETGTRTRNEISEQVKVLAQMAPDPGQAEGERQRQELAAIEDHWWVQMQKDGNWLDLDPLNRAGSPGDAPAEAVETIPVAEVNAELSHEVTIRVIVEQFQAGRLTEHQVLEQAIRPAQLIGQDIALVFVPANLPPGDEQQTGAAFEEQLKSRLLNVKAWRPALKIGGKVVARDGFTDSGEIKAASRTGKGGGVGQGVGGLFGGLAGEEPTEEQQPPAQQGGQLSAVWLEFELRSPGGATQKIRREVMDMLTPSARVSTAPTMPELSEGRRLQRALDLLGVTEILPLVCDLSPEFVTQLYLQPLMAKRGAFLSLAAAGTSAPRDDMSSALQGLVSMPGLLHAFALGRQSFSGVRADRFIDRPNILCFYTRLKAEQGRLLQQMMVDIVNNDVGIRPGARTPPYMLRLEQGVVDTVVEGAVFPRSGQSEGVADVLGAAAAQRTRMALIRQKGDQGWQTLAAGADVRARMESDLNEGYVIVAPTQPVDINGHRALAWWRVHPVSGAALGVMESGFHQAMTQDAIDRTAISDTLISDTVISDTIVTGGGAGSGGAGGGGLMGAFGAILRVGLTGVRWALWTVGMGGGAFHRWVYGQLAQLLMHIQELIYNLTGKFG